MIQPLLQFQKKRDHDIPEDKILAGKILEVVFRSAILLLLDPRTLRYSEIPT